MKVWYNKALMKVSSSVFVKGIRGTDDIVTAPQPHYAFVGRSNVGKSSLINALCNKNDLVKVSRKPGKTTEINYFLINDAFYFVDLPGYGYAKVSPGEKEKIKKLIIWYLTGSGAKPNRVALILDVKVGITEFDKQMIEILTEQAHPFILVANKIDKLTQKELAQKLGDIKKEAAGAEVVPSSAEMQGGTKLLLQELFKV
jgi:GTP-binding protein